MSGAFDRPFDDWGIINASGSSHSTHHHSQYMHNHARESERQTDCVRMSGSRLPRVTAVRGVQHAAPRVLPSAEEQSV